MKIAGAQAPIVDNLASPLVTARLGQLHPSFRACYLMCFVRSFLFFLFACLHHLPGKWPFSQFDFYCPLERTLWRRVLQFRYGLHDFSLLKLLNEMSIIDKKGEVLLTRINSDQLLRNKFGPELLQNGSSVSFL